MGTHRSALAVTAIAICLSPRMTGSRVTGSETVLRLCFKRNDTVALHYDLGRWVLKRPTYRGMAPSDQKAISHGRQPQGVQGSAMQSEDILAVGAGPAGLATSACLRREGLAHVVLERGVQIANA
jgi:hypothetical protein